MNGKWLAAFALASLCGVAHADPNTRLPCTTDNTNNCYTPYVHPDNASGGGGSSGGAVYGTDATGAAPTKPPLFIAGVDGNGKIVPFTITANGLQFFATSLPLPTGASTDASVQAVKTTLGSPFQAGGSVGNTGFNALQNGAANSATNQFYEQTVGPSMQAPGTAPTVVRGVQGAPGGLPIGAAEQGSSLAGVGVTPAVTQAGTSAVGKASQGNLYSAYAVNTTTTAGYLVLINATAAPSSGAAITPVDVAALGGTVGAPANVNYGAGPPNAYSTGIVALITTSLTTYTPGGNAFIQVRAR